MDKAKTSYVAVSLACFSTMLGGMTVALTRLVISETEPLSLALIRYGIAAIILLAYFLYTEKMIPRVAKPDIWALIVLGLFMFTLFPSLMARALVDTSAAHGGLIFSTMPLITMIISVTFGVEAINRYKVAGVAIAIIGTLLALETNTDSFKEATLWGDIYMFLGITSASIFNVFSKKYLILYGYLFVIAFTLIIGVAGLLVLALIFESPFTGSLSFSPTGWFVVLLLAIPGGTLMVAIWGKVLQMISPTQAAITIGFNPLTAIVLGAWFLSEGVSELLFVGLILILVAIIVASYDPKPAGNS